ncbi:hypothetical protein ACFQJD_09965 [Haloplanus sp. GCM10025708]|uniref:DUF7837 family putative zinc-binding protein n=1 Tax=Haloferacaceae TaxID=1644056 RepID=UPI00361A0820
MTHGNSTAGTCPECGRRLHAERVLVEYERTDGSRGVYAECPACDAVVTPD